MIPDNPVMRLLREVLAAPDSAQMLKIGPMAFLFDREQGRVTGSAPASTLVKLLNTAQLQGKWSLHPVPAAQVDAVVQERFPAHTAPVRHALDEVIWDMVGEAIDAIASRPLAAGDELLLQLRNFPNFTQLHRVDPLDVQLASICSAAPRSVQELLELFPGHRQQVLRFVLQCVLSGLALVRPADAGERGIAPPVHAAGDGRRGFFRSLLAKLF